MHPTAIIIIKLLFVMLTAGLIGYEREIHGSHAGLKTHILVGIGATTIALLQLEILKEYPSGDPSRLIAQVVSGIGFLGAGTIIVTRSTISGLTTAASIWTVATIGLAIGMGQYEVAITTTLMTAVVLFVFRKYLSIKKLGRLYIEFDGDPNVVEKIKTILKQDGLKFSLVNYELSNSSSYKILVEFKRVLESDFDGVVSQLSHVPEIKKIRRNHNL